MLWLILDVGKGLSSQLQTMPQVAFENTRSEGGAPWGRVGAESSPTNLQHSRAKCQRSYVTRVNIIEFPQFPRLNVQVWVFPIWRDP